ncbi:Riboflavin transporter MCH5 [Cyphellophora attinorum]|uniref:Riboflavin transporter MCH5 n=1 Tax=Cyphellophora attinorum TaxID=1664694 RepID=A0A0N1NXI2_9EURO|nr:Riboflavin transporter MCH5 [Phialophora attinorum]KPI37057.1 Riboflavin transporter MCH5 [Phialophora attinorum]
MSVSTSSTATSPKEAASPSGVTVNGNHTTAAHAPAADDTNTHTQPSTLEKGSTTAEAVPATTTTTPNGIAIDPASFPDGGTRAWLTVLGCFCTMTITFGWIQSVGVFQAYYELNQLRAYSHSEVSWITSFTAFWLFAGGLVVGPLGDKHGPKALLIGGTLLHSFGLFMASLATKYYQFILSQGVCSAIGTSMLLYPSISCVVSWFYAKRATAIGIAASGSGLGGVVFPLVVRQMLQTDHVGYPWTMRTIAFLVLLLGSIACLTITSRLPPTPKMLTKDEIRKSLKDSLFVLVWITGPLAFLPQWLVLTFIVTTAYNDRHVDPNWAFYLVPICNSASFFGRLIPGYLADRTGSITMYTYLMVYTFIVTAALWIPVSGQAGMVVFAVLFGFGSGGLNALSPAVIAQISDVRTVGLRTGLIYAVTGVCCLFASPAGGAIISHSGYRSMQGFAAAVMGVVALLTVYIRYRVGGMDLRKKI